MKLFINRVFSMAIYITKFLFNLLNKLIKQITNKLRFSITFKITVTYVSIFILLSTITNILVLVGFEHFIISNSPSNYVYILAIILFIFSILGTLSIVFIGSKTSRKLVSPIETMTKTAKEISINALDKRLDVSGSKDELKDLAITFNEMLDRIQISVEQQNQFVSDASHELRTPIAVIQGYANLLNRWGKDDKEVLEESIRAIKSESEDMKYLVENLLFLARGDKNTQKINKKTFLLNKVIDEIINETRIIDSTHAILSEHNEEFTINGDKGLIKEALRIFIDNSIKYTPSEGIIILNSLNKSNKAIITIEDTGIGIPQDDISNIFNRFYRADKSRTKRSGGTGLGLPIAKWIINNHNGIINVWSKEGIGTKITLEIPIK